MVRSVFSPHGHDAGDSMDSALLERDLGTSVDDEDLLLENFGTIADIARLVESKKTA